MDNIWADNDKLAKDALGDVCSAFPELDPEVGTYQRLSQPQKAVLHMIEHVPDAVPSVHLLSGDNLVFLEALLSIPATYFNLAQFMQGENLPSNIKLLQQFISEHQGREKLLPVYLLSVVGDMSGLAGGRFLGEKNARMMLSAFKMLQELDNADPLAIYWGYMKLRAQQLQVPTFTPDAFALARLMVLNRLHDATSVGAVRDAWESLDSEDREVLTEHFLADSIVERAVLFLFLPLFLANAMKNKAVGLSTALQLLADLVEKLRLNSIVLEMDAMMVAVDLSGLASFTISVKNKMVFQSCLENSKLKEVGTMIQLEMTSKNWSRVHYQDANQDTSTKLLNQISRRQRRLQRTAERFTNDLQFFLTSRHVVSVSHI